MKGWALDNLFPQSQMIKGVPFLAWGTPKIATTRTVQQGNSGKRCFQKRLEGSRSLLGLSTRRDHVRFMVRCCVDETE